MYIVIAIRGLDHEFRWNGSYLVGIKENLSEAIELAKEETKQRGYYKYGCVVYCNIPDSTEVYTILVGYEEGILNKAYQNQINY